MKHRALILALALLGGCNNGLAPLRGDLYALQSIAGVSLPAPYVANAIEGNRIIADTIALEADGTGMRRTLYGHLPEASRQEAELTYTRTGARIEINFRCRDTNDCIPGPHLSGTITDTGITIDQSTVYSLKPFQYSRLR